uniref:Uncharacterized protein n=1 Tax=Sicyonia whispovirus TaxID=2984283 RepID=A0A9C7BX16_9VIRU|nr:MAG: hypothetical protein [Sicyonia whispovirus]
MASLDIAEEVAPKRRAGQGAPKGKKLCLEAPDPAPTLTVIHPTEKYELSDILPVLHSLKQDASWLLDDCDVKVKIAEASRLHVLEAEKRIREKVRQQVEETIKENALQVIKQKVKSDVEIHQIIDRNLNAMAQEALDKKNSHLLGVHDVLASKAVDLSQTHFEAETIEGPSPFLAGLQTVLHARMNIYCHKGKITFAEFKYPALFSRLRVSADPPYSDTPCPTLFIASEMDSTNTRQVSKIIFAFERGNGDERGPLSVVVWASILKDNKELHEATRCISLGELKQTEEEGVRRISTGNFRALTIPPSVSRARLHEMVIPPLDEPDHHIISLSCFLA